MFRIRKVLPLAAALVVAVALGMPSSAHATFAVKITTTVGTQTIFDGGAGDTDGLVNNQIHFNYSDSAYNLIGSSSLTNAPGTSAKAILDITYSISTLDLGSGASTGGAATLEASATGFNQPNPNPLSMSSKINGNGDGTGTLTVQAYADTTNTLFGTGPNTTGPQGPFNIGAAGGYNNTSSTTFNKAGDYALTDVITFNLSPDSSATGDSLITVTAPAPAGLLIAFAAAPFLGLTGWLKRRRAKSV